MTAIAMSKGWRLLASAFDALGDMISFDVGDRRRGRRELPTVPQPRQGIGRHFEAVWGYLGKAMADYEKCPD